MIFKQANIFYSRYFLVMSLLCLAFLSFSQGFENHDFKSITVNENLSHSDVNCIVQDQQGYIWIGTNNGLNKYDGYKIETYKKIIDDPTSIPGNRITDIIVDHNGLIWVSVSNKGLYTFDPGLMNFKKVEIKSWSMVNNDLYDFTIITASDNSIWIKNEKNQLIRIEINESSEIIGEEIVSINNDYNEIVSTTASSIGIFLLGVDGELGMVSYNQLKFDWINYNLKEYGSIQQLTTKNSKLYAITESHLLIYNLSSNEIRLDQVIELKLNAVYGIENLLVDMYDDVWFCTRMKVYKMVTSNPKEQQAFEIKNVPSLQVQTLYEDKFGVLWFCTVGFGVYYTNLVKKPFYYLSNEVENSKLVASIYRDEEKNIWLGSRQGLAIFEPIAHPYHYELKKQYLKDKYICFINKDKENNIYLGLKNTGIYKVKKINGEYVFKNMAELIDDDLSAMENLMRMTIDDKGRLWVSTFVNGIFILDLKNRRAERIVHVIGDTMSLSSNKLTDIYCDPLLGDVWVGTRDAGLNKITYHEGGNHKISNFQYRIDDTSTISSNHTWQVLRSKDSSLWVATLGGGLNQILYDEKSKQHSFRRFSTKNGLVDNDVEGIAEDNEGNLWISGVGISKFNKKTHELYHYDYLDGLQSNSFKVGATFQDEDDWVYFGGINGINYFLPSQIEEDTIRPKVYISKIIVNNGSNDIKTLKVEEQTTLSLSAYENNLTFNFIGLQFNAPKKNQYKFKLQGHDKDWTYADYPNLSANYLNVPPGEYTFQVMASNSDGIWNENIAEANLKIAKPWYFTSIAFLSYLILIGLALYLFKRITEKQIQLKNDLLLAEKEHEMDRSKLSFFTKISHELRSPLTLIKGPLEELLLFSKISQLTKNKLLLMQKSTDRLLNLTNQLLDFRKMETGNMQLQARNQDFIKFAKELFLLFSQSASNKDIKFEFSSSHEKLKLVFDANKMEIILMNLLSNAFKYTPFDGSVKMKIEVIGNPEKDAVWKNGQFLYNYVKVEVIDNGAGMSENEVNKVFNPYYQVRNVSATQPIGTGLGLSLVKGLVELHEGEILISSKLDEGTKCSILLPFGQSHLKEDQIDTSIQEKDKLSPYDAIEKSVQSAPEFNDYLERFGVLSKKHKILIVEDNLELNAYIKEVLSEEFVVEPAFNGKEGYELALEFEPDLILSDVMMPVMDGISLCEKIKQDDVTAHIPIILLTARTSFVYQVNGLSKGAEDYISKPFSTSLLITKIHAILKNRELQREFYRKQLFFEPIKETHLNADEQIVYNAIQYIEDNVNNIDLDVKSLADAMCQSQSNLYRKVKLVTGKSLVELIKDVKIKYAGRLLREQKYTVTEVAYKSGFSSIKYFRKCFKAQYKVNPSEFHLVDFSDSEEKLDKQIKYN